MDPHCNLQFLMPILKLESEIAGLIHPSAVLQGGLVARIPCLLALHLSPHQSTITLAAAAADLSMALLADFALWRENCFPHLHPFLWRWIAMPTNSPCTSTSYVLPFSQTGITAARRLPFPPFSPPPGFCISSTVIH